MFKKKTCDNCGKKVEDKHDFCPSCGNYLGVRKRDKKKDFGILGKDDSLVLDEKMMLPPGLNLLMNSLMKNLERQFKNLDREEMNMKNKSEVKKSGIKISISTSMGKQPQIKIDSFGNDVNRPKVTKSLPSLDMAKVDSRKIKNLPREEALTDIRRFSDKVVYEINLPNVKSLDDISINKLESSIEIKAVSKDKVYVKLIPVNLPIVDYNFSKGKLVLELGEK